MGENVMEPSSNVDMTIKSVPLTDAADHLNEIAGQVSELEKKLAEVHTIIAS